MRISDWSSDVCSSDLQQPCLISTALPCRAMPFGDAGIGAADRFAHGDHWPACAWLRTPVQAQGGCRIKEAIGQRADMQCPRERSEEHTSELQSLMRISYAVFCLKKKKNINHKHKQQF